MRFESNTVRAWLSDMTTYEYEEKTSGIKAISGPMPALTGDDGEDMGRLTHIRFTNRETRRRNAALAQKRARARARLRRLKAKRVGAC